MVLLNYWFIFFLGFIWLEVIDIEFNDLVINYLVYLCLNVYLFLIILIYYYVDKRVNENLLKVLMFG